MGPVVPNPDRILAFPDPQTFERWLEDHHDRAPEIWIRMHKKASGLPTISHSEALDVALCWGWIDGQRKGLDETSFLQRFSPRRPKSLWSVVNTERVERLTAAGRMTPHGQRQVDAAKADGRWARAYNSPSKTTLPDDLMAAIAAEPLALETLGTLNATNRFALAYRVQALRTPAGRRRKIAALVDMLKRGETPHPQPKSSRGKS